MVGLVEKPWVWRIEVAVPRKVCCIAVKFRVDICQAKLLIKAKAHWHHRDAPIVPQNPRGPWLPIWKVSIARTLMV